MNRTPTINTNQQIIVSCNPVENEVGVLYYCVFNNSDFDPGGSVFKKIKHNIII